MQAVEVFSYKITSQTLNFSFSNLYLCLYKGARKSKELDKKYTTNVINIEAKHKD